MKHIRPGAPFVDGALIRRAIPPWIRGLGDVSAEDLDRELGRARHGAPAIARRVDVVSFELGSRIDALEVTEGTEAAVLVVRWADRPIGVVEVPVHHGVAKAADIAGSITKAIEWRVGRAALLDWIRHGPDRTVPLDSPPRATPPVFRFEPSFAELDLSSDADALVHACTGNIVDLVALRSAGVLDDHSTRASISHAFLADPELAMLWIPAVPGRVETPADYQVLLGATDGFSARRERVDLTLGVPGPALPAWFARTSAALGSAATVRGQLRGVGGLLVVRADAVRATGRQRGATVASLDSFLDGLLGLGWAAQVGGEMLVWHQKVAGEFGATKNRAAEVAKTSEAMDATTNARRPWPTRTPPTPIPNTPVYVGCDRYDLDSGEHRDRTPSANAVGVSHAESGHWSPLIRAVPGIKVRDVEVIRKGRRVGIVEVPVHGGSVRLGLVDEAIVDQLGYACTGWADADQSHADDVLLAWSERVESFIADPAEVNALPLPPLPRSPRTRSRHRGEPTPVSIVVVVVVQPGDGELARCLLAISSAAVRTSAAVDTVIVDTRPETGDGPVVADADLSSGFSVVSAPGRDPATARRVGLDHGRQRRTPVDPDRDAQSRLVVLFIGAHIILEPLAIEALRSTWSERSDDVGAVVGSQAGNRVEHGAARRGGPQELGSSKTVYRSEHDVDRWFVDHIVGSADLLAVSIDALSSEYVWPGTLPGADGRPCCGDDAMACAALLQNGYSVIFDPAVVGWSWGGWNLATERRRRRSIARSQLAASVAWARDSNVQRRPLRSTAVRRVLGLVLGVAGRGERGRISSLLALFDAARTLRSAVLTDAAPATKTLDDDATSRATVRTADPKTSSRPSSILWVVGGRFGHHAGRSGYDRMFAGDTKLAPSVGFRWVTHPRLATINRRLTESSGTEIYSIGAFANECSAALTMLRHRRDRFHFLYGDSDSWFVPAFARRLGIDVSVSLHIPVARMAELDLDLGRFRTSSAVVIMDESQRSYVETRVAPALVVAVRHGVDTDFFCLGTKRKEPMFLCVGAHMRDFGTLFEGWRRFASTHREHRLVLVGISSDARRMLAASPLERVVISPRLDDAALVQHYQRAVALVLPLLDATANNSMLEAMACGTPVITTDLPATRSYSGTSAVFVGPGDASGLADAMARMVNEPSFAAALAINGRKAAEELSFERVGPALLDTLTSTSQDR